MTQHELGDAWALLIGGFIWVAQPAYGFWKGQFRPFRTTYRYVRSKEPVAFYRAAFIMLMVGFICCTLGLKDLVPYYLHH